MIKVSYVIWETVLCEFLTVTTFLHPKLLRHSTDLLCLNVDLSSCSESCMEFSAPNTSLRFPVAWCTRTKATAWND